MDKIFKHIFNLISISEIVILKEIFYEKHTLAYGKKKKIFKDKLFQRFPKLN